MSTCNHESILYVSIGSNVYVSYMLCVRRIKMHESILYVSYMLDVRYIYMLAVRHADSVEAVRHADSVEAVRHADSVEAVRHADSVEASWHVDNKRMLDIQHVNHCMHSILALLHHAAYEFQ